MQKDRGGLGQRKLPKGCNVTIFNSPEVNMQDAFNGEEISPIPTEEVFEQSEYRRKQEWATKLPCIVGVGLLYKFIISLQTGRLISSNGASSSATPHASLRDVKKRNAETLSVLFYLAYKLDEQLEALSDE